MEEHLVTAPDKRARKKQHRDEVRAVQQAALQRRRNMRLLGAIALLAGLVVAAMIFSNEETGAPEPASPGADEAAAPTDAAACGAEPPPAATC